MIKLSVIVTVYETEDYLARCIDSIINQTLKEIEIIIINDGSPDNSQEIIDRYMAADSRIMSIKTENRGVSKARNLGIELARGEYISLIDSDDYLDERMFELMCASIAKNNCNMCVCNVCRVFENRLEPPYLKLSKNEVIAPLENHADFIKKIFSKKETIGGSVWNKVYKSSFLKASNVRFVDRSEIYAEDALFVYEILPIVKRFCIVDLPLYYYYQRSSSVSYSYKENLLERYKNFLNDTISYYQSFALYENVKEELCALSFTFFIEALHNECISRPEYKNFKKIFKDKFMWDMTQNADISHYSFPRRFIYYLYRLRLYALIYFMFILNYKFMR